MQLFWKDRQGTKSNESWLLAEPAAKLCSVEFADGVYHFKCLGVYEKLRVGTFEEAKRLAEVRLRSVLKDIQIELHRDVSDEATYLARLARQRKEHSGPSA